MTPAQGWFNEARCGVFVPWGVYAVAGRGQCRVPKSWRLIYEDVDTWKPVDAAGAYNRAMLAPVSASSWRV